MHCAILFLSSLLVTGDSVTAQLCNRAISPKVVSDFVQRVAYSWILPRLAEKPTSVKQWSTHRSCATCHLQLYKCSTLITCNCGTPLVRITQTQNSQLNIKEQHDSFKVYEHIALWLYGSTQRRTFRNTLQ